MPVQPRKKVENIEFFEQRAPIWAANAAQLNLSPEETAELVSLTGTARTKYTEAQLKAEQAKTATANQDAAVDAMRGAGGELIKKIRVTVEQTGDTSLYGLAQIPAPKDPTPIPPVEASDLDFTLLNNGDLELFWEGSVSTGTTYIVRRSLTNAQGTELPFEAVGFADEKRYVDKTIPQGTRKVSYEVVAKKGSTITAGSLPITVRFGKGANGQTIAEVA